MNYKLKYCNGCNKEKLIWKNTTLNGVRVKLCKSCWGKQNPSMIKEIAKKSIKRISLDNEYSKLRKEYLKENEYCQIKFSCCTKYSTEIHHSYSGKDRSEHYLNIKTWYATCRMCHAHVHAFPKEARLLNFLK
jgi:hypothetical protein